MAEWTHIQETPQEDWDGNEIGSTIEYYNWYNLHSMYEYYDQNHDLHNDVWAARIELDHMANIICREWWWHGRLISTECESKEEWEKIVKLIPFM